MNFKFGKRLHGFDALLAALAIGFLFTKWNELPVPFNYIAGTLFVLSYVVLFVVWLGSNYIWPPGYVQPPEGEGEGEE